MSKTHKLKVHESMWEPLRDGEKTAEFRRNDRDFVIGDTLRLYPVNDDGRETFMRGVVWINFVVTHIVKGPSFGIPEGYCMLSLGPFNSIVNDADNCVGASTDKMEYLSRLHIQQRDTIVRKDGRIAELEEALSDQLTAAEVESHPALNTKET